MPVGCNGHDSVNLNRPRTFCDSFLPPHPTRPPGGFEFGILLIIAKASTAFVGNIIEDHIGGSVDCVRERMLVIAEKGFDDMLLSCSWEGFEPLLPDLYYTFSRAYETLVQNGS